MNSLKFAYLLEVKPGGDPLELKVILFQEIPGFSFFSILPRFGTHLHIYQSLVNIIFWRVPKLFWFLLYYLQEES